jgi:hypothetical protein
MSKVFFSVTVAISSGPGDFLGETLSIARHICFMVMLGTLGLLGTGSG